jgi:Na+-transporting methylmalonyl-CoA/oxaloacetate decarboxylase gamma subunit
MEIAGSIAFVLGVLLLLVFASLRLGRYQDTTARMPQTIHEQKMALYRRAQKEVAEQLRLRKERQ